MNPRSVYNFLYHHRNHYITRIIIIILCILCACTTRGHYDISRVFFLLFTMSEWKNSRAHVKKQNEMKKNHYSNSEIQLLLRTYTRTTTKTYNYCSFTFFIKITAVTAEAHPVNYKKIYIYIKLLLLFVFCGKKILL